ncbi:MAG: hypothetical protein K2L27_05250 [Muribaculaceae bacterium]|nr:hypothetical protein [Muribaculaceae bacterium]
MKRLYILAAAAMTAASMAAAEGEWHMVEDFEGNHEQLPELVDVTTGNQMATGRAYLDVVPHNGVDENHAMHVTDSDLHPGLKITLALPEGMKLADFDAVDFDVYNYEMNYKDLYVKLGDDVICADKSWQEYGFGGQEEHYKWKHFSFDFNANGSDATSVVLIVGFKNVHAANAFALDNIRFKELGEAPAPPVEYYPTRNGEMVSGELMVNDFQQHADVNIQLPLWNQEGAETKGSSKTASDPTDEKNLVAHFQVENGDYNTIHEMEVTLPEGKALKNYSEVKFKLYRHSGDADYKQMRVQADDDLLHIDLDDSGNDTWINQAPEQQWVEKSYAIKKDTNVGNNFKLRLGIKTDNGNYLVDDVRLVRRVATGIEDVVADGSDAEAAVYYDLRGVRIGACPSAPGIYVRRQGNTAVKVMVK